MNLFSKILGFFFCFISCLLFGIPSVSFLLAEDWPQWRGPSRDGIWQEKGIFTKFDQPQLPILWRAPVANGYSGPTVANDRVYVTDRLANPVEKERIHCLNAITGQEIWSHSYDCHYQGVAYPNGPRAAVTVHDMQAYSLGTMGNLFCYDAEKGDIIWSRDLLSEYKIKMPVWGIAASPLIENNLLIVVIGGADHACLVAFDKETGSQGNLIPAETGSRFPGPIPILEPSLYRRL